MQTQQIVFNSDMSYNKYLSERTINAKRNTSNYKKLNEYTGTTCLDCKHPREGSDMSFELVGQGDSDDTIFPEINIAKYCSHQDANTTLNAADAQDLSILYLNIVSLPHNMNDLLIFLSRLDKKPDLITFSETKITDIVNTYYHPYLEGYTYHGISSKTYFGSVGVFIRNSLIFNIRTDLNCSERALFEMIWFDISSNDINARKSTVGIVYRHHGKPSIPCFTSKMKNIIQKLNREKANYYILGDFNINLIKTDDEYNISDFVNTMHSLNALNLINIPTRFPQGRQNGNPSILDQLWTNQPHRINKIELIMDPISDHSPMLFVVKLHKNIAKPHPCSYFVRDMKNFSNQEFNESIFNFVNPDGDSDLDLKFFRLQNHITYCINKHAPLRKRTKKELRFVAKPWISNSIQISIDNKNNLYQYLLKHENHELKRKYNKMKKTLKKTISIAEQNFYGRLFEQCQNNSRKIWALINEITCRKKRDNNTINTIKTASGLTTSNAKSIANTLNHYFTNIGKNMSNRLPDAPIPYQQFLKNRQLNSFYLKPTDEMEILEMINTFSSNKYTGPIPAKFVKIGAPALSNILSELINECFSTGKYPDTLKIARITPIYKGGLKDIPSNYRPISILPVLSKLIEKLTYNRLIKYIDKKSILNSSQFGFRKVHSTSHAITSICEKILENVNNDQHTISIYLDLSKAFDSVNHTILLSKLEHYGVRGVALDFFRSYLNKRQQFTIVNGQASELLTVICGVPQGSTLGPLLFLLYINDLATASNFSVTLFADDTSLLLKHQNLNTLVRKCNLELVHINNWFLANKLTANMSKASKFMLTLGKSRMKHPENITLKMGDTILEKVNSIKYLGVIFDDSFNWHNHVSYISSKISRSVGVLSKLRYYTTVQTLIKVYHSLVSSHLSYALTAWGKAGVAALQPLRVLQNRAIRFISRAPRFRRLDNDYLNLRILKLDDLYELAVYKFMHQYYHGKLPNFFEDYFPENHISHQYRLRNGPSTFRPFNCRKVSMERSIRFHGPKIWDKLSSVTKSLSASKFKKKISNILLSNY